MVWSEQYVIEASVGSLQLMTPSRLAWLMLGHVGGIGAGGVGVSWVWLLFALSNTLSLALLLFAYSVWFFAPALVL